jgi:hypothetical protein
VIAKAGLPCVIMTNDYTYFKQARIMNGAVSTHNS